MTSPACRASRRSQLPPSLRHAVPGRWRRGIPKAGQPFASSDPPRRSLPASPSARVLPGWLRGMAASAGAEPRRGPSTRKRAGTAQDPEGRTRIPVAGPFRIPSSGDDAPRPAPHRPAASRNIPRIRLFRWSSGMRTPALKAPDGRPSRSCRGQAAWPGQRGGGEQVSVVGQRPCPGAAGCYSYRVVAGAAGEAGGEGLGAGAGLVAFGYAELVVELADLGEAGASLDGVPGL